eukprot:CAMPEP_0114318116 /NCGR_PEP_ID=MMETSP0059-20121206/24365_1 /TAXON_ID=36894 /ORGANISM="Pyramimonas parkeae, Strain CCMP726" /LENGTH=264 /DNA_ID=CAMNT_0001444693 /DNA_START=234 /DNA_END=1025 /DNA_ORIENTATION=+
MDTPSKRKTARTGPKSNSDNHVSDCNPEAAPWGVYQDLVQPSTVCAAQATSSRSASATCLLAAPLLAGMDKWLGGELGLDGSVYAVPGSARSVLRIEPLPSHDNDNPNQVCQYRLSLVGSLCNPTVRSSMSRNRFKWLRGALARDRAIYGIPSNADCVLRIVPPTRPGEEPRVETIPDYNPRGRSKEEMKQLESHFAFLKGQWKWHGAVLGKDGVLYGIPSNADKVLRVVPASGPDFSEQPLVDVVDSMALPGKNKWYGGLISP